MRRPSFTRLVRRFLITFAVVAAVWVSEPSPSAAQGGGDFSLLELWIFLVDMDEATLPTVDIRNSADGSLVETVHTLGFYQLGVDSGAGSLYFDLPPGWVVDGIECVGAHGTPGGVRQDAVTVHIDYNLAAGAGAECQAALRPERDEGVWGDVNCDTLLDVIDALVIAQYVVGIRTGSDVCPGNAATELHVGRADINADGFVDVIDALEAARCNAGITEARCTPVSGWSVADVHLLAWPREIVDLPDGTIYANSASHIERIAPDGTRSQFGDFTFGNGLHLAEDGTFWATDSRGPNRIYHFDADGSELTYFGSQGSGVGQFECPNSIHVDHGEVFVFEGDNDRIQVFDEQGNFLRGWGRPGDAPGEFDVDCGTASLVVFDDEVYVSDCRNLRVQVFDRDGTFNGSWSVEGQVNVFGAFCSSGITADAAGRIYLADEYHWIRVYTRDGEFIETVWSAYEDWRSDGFDGLVSEDPRFDEVYGIHVNPEGTRLWASLNQVPQRIIVFDRQPDE